MPKTKRARPPKAEVKVTRKRGLQPGVWYALLHHPADLPVLFASRKAAKENRLSMEYLVTVRVAPLRKKDLCPS